MDKTYGEPTIPGLPGLDLFILDLDLLCLGAGVAIVDATGYHGEHGEALSVDPPPKEFVCILLMTLAQGDRGTKEGRTGCQDADRHKRLLLELSCESFVLGFLLELGLGL